MANLKTSIQLGFNPWGMDWKKEDYDKVVDSIENKQDPPYTRGWMVQAKAVGKGCRVFVYYAAKKKFIASGYVVSDEVTTKEDSEGKTRNWVQVTFDWIVDYEDENAGLAYETLKNAPYGLSINLFEKRGQIQGGCTFLKDEGALETLERAWKDACPGYPGCQQPFFPLHL